jgi:hypothetical protein
MQKTTWHELSRTVNHEQHTSIWENYLKNDNWGNTTPEQRQAMQQADTIEEYATPEEAEELEQSLHKLALKYNVSISKSITRRIIHDTNNWVSRTLKP